MNTRDEIATAYADYRRTGFGGWPWPEDAMVWPREEGRFASQKKDGEMVLERPPAAAAAPATAPATTTTSTAAAAVARPV